MKKNILFLAAFFATLFLTSVTVLAAPAGTVREKDAGYEGDAPDKVDLAQDAPVLTPGRYGTTQSGAVFDAPLFSKKGDRDVYKVTVYPGVMMKFKVTPHARQNIAIKLYNSGGENVASPQWWLKSYSQPWDEKAAGFAEELIYMQGLNLSHAEDGLITFYLEVYDNRADWSLPEDYGKERYTVDYEEINTADGEWTVDAPKHLIRTPKLDWNKTYAGYLGYHDNVDCYQVVPSGAAGDRVKVTAKPIDPSLDIDMEPYGDFYDANAQALANNLTSVDTTAWVKIGTREYLKEEIVYEYNNGAAGFPNTFEIYPYYAQGQWSSNSSFAYFCLNLKKGGGQYEVSISNSAGSGAEPVPADITTLVFPPEALKAPVAPDIREKVILSIPYFGDELDIELVAPGGGGEEEEEETESLVNFKIGDEIPFELRDKTKEADAKKIFKKVFGRKPRTKVKADLAAIQAIAYNLSPKKANTKRETKAAAHFKSIFEREPTGEEDMAIVKALAYSRAKIRKVKPAP